MLIDNFKITQSHQNNSNILGKICPDEIAQVIGVERCKTAHQTIIQWNNYSPTALILLPDLAETLGVKSIYYKDESTRFGLSSFKALGGAYAVQRVLLQQLKFKLKKQDISLNDINTGVYKNQLSDLTVVTATDGNHGRSVAWGAERFGCNCIIYMHEKVSEARQKAVERYGAKVVRVKGNYDNSVHKADHDAKENNWHIVSDTSYPGYMDIPRDVMAGYTLMTHETINQLPKEGPIPTHVFIQGGCGGLAGAVCADLWINYGENMPCLVVVEPVSAACLYESSKAGKSVLFNIVEESLMAGLSCGEVSLLGWKILEHGAHHFFTVDDEPVAPLMKMLAEGSHVDPAIVAGESAVAGLAGLIGALNDPILSKRLNLNQDSRVILFGTEGATDPNLYNQLIND